MSESSPTTHQFAAHSLPLTSVTVFNDRAEIKRTVKVHLKKGTNEVIVENVSKFADEASIRVDGRGDAVIHEVQFQKKASILDDLRSPRLQELESQRKALKEEQDKLEDRRQVIDRQVEVFDKIISEAGGSAVKGPSEEAQSFQVDESALQNITKFFDFYAHSAVEKRRKLRECDEELRELADKIRKLTSEIGRAQNDSRFAKNINVLLECNEDVSVELDISYQVWHASWHPSYDIRVSPADDGQSTMKIMYYGKIEQTTGEDWIDAPIILSTARPAIGGIVPELGTLNAKFYKPQPQPPPRPRPMMMMAAGGAVRHRKMLKRDAAAEDEVEMDEEMGGGFGEMAIAAVSARDTTLSTVFNIPRPATISSGSGEHKVTITILDLEPIMVHETVPSKDTNVYVSASAVNLSPFPLLAGEASVYLGNSFIAKARLKAISPGERFICSLSVDPAISVEYKPAHRFSEQVGLITKSASMVHEQRIVIKNTKQTKVLLTIKEYIPKSTDEKIKIRLFAPELQKQTQTENLKQGLLPPVGARLDENHNLEWTLYVEPNRETDLLVKWTLEYPNNETIEFSERFSSNV